MNAIAQTFAILAGLIHVIAFVAESLLFRNPRVQKVFLGKPVTEAGVFLWAYNQGFYNLFLAAGPIAGVIAYHAGQVSAGRALVVYGGLFMIGAGVVLVTSDRRLWRGALGQIVPALVAVLATLRPFGG